jgi:hypothetical protein
VPRREGITLLMDQAAVELAAHGRVRGPAGPWIRAATVLLNVRNSCGWDMEHTPVTLLEPFQTHQGWVWRWEGEDLVIELPGWVQPAPVILAIQPGLFD